MGRQKKPIELHLVDGTYRADRQLPDAMTAAPVVQIPMPPKSIGKNKEAKALWYTVAGELSTLGVLSNLDLVTLEMYCQQVIIYRAAVAKYYEDPEAYIETLVGSKGQEVKLKNKYFSVADDAFRKIVLLAAQLGLTPAARAQIGVRAINKGDKVRGLMRK